MGIALRDQSGNLRGSEYVLGDATAKMPSPASRTRPSVCGSRSSCSIPRALRWSIFCATAAAHSRRCERARDLGIVLDEHLVRDAERARTELDVLSQVISANLTRAALEAAPAIADLSKRPAEVAGKAGIAWERLFDAPEEKSLRTLRY